MKVGICAVIAACAALSSCASPLVKPSPLAWQVKSQHAHDWETLAVRVVERLPSTTNSERPTVYVEEGPYDTPFAEAYSRFLAKALFDHGYPVLDTPAGASIIIKTDTQWLLYCPGNNKPLTDYASLYTTAAAVGGQLRHISSLDTGFLAGLGVGPVLDFLTSMNGTTNAEVIVSTSIESNGHYHYLGSETMYVQPTDLSFFMTSQRGRNLPVAALRVGAFGR